jgi:hypothetical protein
MAADVIKVSSSVTTSHPPSTTMTSTISSSSSSINENGWVKSIPFDLLITILSYHDARGYFVLSATCHSYHRQLSSGNIMESRWNKLYEQLMTSSITSLSSTTFTTSTRATIIEEEEGEMIGHQLYESRHHCYSGIGRPVSRLELIAMDNVMMISESIMLTHVEGKQMTPFSNNLKHKAPIIPSSILSPSSEWLLNNRPSSPSSSSLSSSSSSSSSSSKSSKWPTSLPRDCYAKRRTALSLKPAPFDGGAHYSPINIFLFGHDGIGKRSIGRRFDDGMLWLGSCGFDSTPSNAAMTH